METMIVVARNSEEQMSCHQHLVPVTHESLDSSAEVRLARFEPYH